MATTEPAPGAEPDYEPDEGHGPAYDSTHIYTTFADMAPLTEQLQAVFGGEVKTYGELNICPQPSLSVVSVLLSPYGLLSLFGFSTPIPYPFGQDKHGYRIRRRDEMIGRATEAGLDFAVAPFDDLGGLQSIVRLPGGSALQFYEPPAEMGFPELTHIPEARIYLGPLTIDPFLAAFTTLTRGTVQTDDPVADGAEVGMPDTTIRRVTYESGYGRLLVLETNGHQPYPYGWDFTGFVVDDLTATLATATAAGAQVVADPHTANGRTSAMVQFLGGFVAEIHQVSADAPA
ncbi:hypothetical protein [Flexivirga meconopsidis]|uniref:hypothetical protein n=1 Tax=Flexivirga meconopsidis TaxID=2977121 RepID=UPI00223E9271|nr:hypothetical protein [Flexivirga meconopsidis]